VSDPLWSAYCDWLCPFLRAGCSTPSRRKAKYRDVRKVLSRARATDHARSRDDEQITHLAGGNQRKLAREATSEVRHICRSAEADSHGHGLGRPHQVFTAPPNVRFSGLDPSRPADSQNISAACPPEIGLGRKRFERSLREKWIARRYRSSA